MSRFSEVFERVTANPYKPGSCKYWFHEDEEKREAYADVLKAYDSGNGALPVVIYRVMKEAYPDFPFRLDTLRDMLKETADGEDRNGH